MKLSTKVAAVAACLGMATCALAQGDADLATRRAKALQHGINASMWFAQEPGRYNVERLRTFTTEDDLKLMRRMGFDHVRISLDAVPLLAWKNGAADGVAYMAELDRVVDAAVADGLAVIVDVHPEDEYKKTMLTGEDNAEAFASLWKALAGHFAKHDPERVFFELMNEPEQTDTARWTDLQTRAIAQIRSVAPQFTVIASAIHWDGLQDLLAFKPLADANVIYSFHDYDPMVFTHQGASWAGDLLKPLRAVPYPSTPENVMPVLAAEPDLKSQFNVEQYGLDRWDAQRLDVEVSFARKWGEQNRVPVYCGEFGVHKPYANAADRARWIHDMRTALEHNGIGWAMWDYSTNFGVVSKEGGKTIVDEGVVKALGLKGTR